MPEELQRAAVRFFVASARVRDLLVLAKHLFVAAGVNWQNFGPTPQDRSGPLF